MRSKTKNKAEDSKAVEAFRDAVWKHYRAAGRHDLPWRQTCDPYRILVSEVMLQQTQVQRVREKYVLFLGAFPDVRALARAELGEVLRHWDGLGYNRRAKYLLDAARTIEDDFGGDMKAATATKLPGVGPYTHAAVRIFAYNEPFTCLETNIRAAFIHHFASGLRRSSLRSLGVAGSVTDKQLVPLVERAGTGQDPRKWHWALMDYGAHLKKIHQNPTRQSASYVMQTKFEGSLRQVRGQILRLLHGGEYGDLAIARELAHDERSVRTALMGLAKDGLVKGEKGSWRIA